MSTLDKHVSTLDSPVSSLDNHVSRLKTMVGHMVVKPGHTVVQALSILILLYLKVRVEFMKSYFSIHFIKTYLNFLHIHFAQILRFTAHPLDTCLSRLDTWLSRLDTKVSRVDTWLSKPGFLVLEQILFFLSHTHLKAVLKE